VKDDKTPTVEVRARSRAPLPQSLPDAKTWRECRACDGSGTRHTEYPNRHVTIEITCQVCNGLGMLQPDLAANRKAHHG
jgi:DnaJ-class molecular chaperone